jgi:8-oxo-dGTP pyrophosphatase MutT (NUDIX family)
MSSEAPPPVGGEGQGEGEAPAAHAPPREAPAGHAPPREPPAAHAPPGEAPAGHAPPREPPAAHDPPREISAGGVVVHEGKVLVIVPAKRAADGSLVLGLPKGHPDAGETLVQAATREVREETGVEAIPIEELGEVRYWYVRRRRRVAKTVYFFLFGYGGGDPADHDDEVLEARWMALAQARSELTYPGEREMVARALAICQQDR